VDRWRYPVDLTGRRRPDDDPEAHSSEEVLLSIDSDTIGGITVDELTGVVDVEVSATLTAALPGRLRGVYDLELLFPSGRVVRLLKGRVRVDPEVTKP
jgi:hypothetical protein